MGGWTAAVIRDKASIKETLARRKPKGAVQSMPGSFSMESVKRSAPHGRHGKPVPPWSMVTKVSGNRAHTNIRAAYVPPPWCPAASH
jgi:hypothetical protein